MLTPSGCLTVVLFLLVAAMSVSEAHWTETDDVCDILPATSPPPPSSESLKHLLISFLPALTENKGRSKHVVGAFKCALKVSHGQGSKIS